MKVKTKDGLEIDVNKEAFNDMETLDALVDLNDEDIFAISRICKKIFSKEEKKKLYDFYRDKNGQVTLEVFMPVFTEIMEALGEEEKNS